MAKLKTPYEIGLEEVDEISLRHPGYARFQKDIARMSRRVYQVNPNLDYVRVCFFTDATWRRKGYRGDYFVIAEFLANGKKFIHMERETRVRKRTLVHKEFSINSKKYQGKGIATEMLRVSKGLCESFDLNKIKVTTGEVGGYAWLRHGFYPAKVNVLDTIFYRSDFLNLELYNKWMSLSSVQKRKFVLTDEFRAYKKALIGIEYEAVAHLDMRGVRSNLFSNRNPCRKPLSVDARLAMASVSPMIVRKRRPNKVAV